jgi:hypothetical protein
MNKDAGFMVVISAFAVAVIAVTAIAGMASAAVSCSTTATAMGLGHKYSIWTGCMVEMDGKFYPLANVRIVK